MDSVRRGEQTVRTSTISNGVNLRGAEHLLQNSTCCCQYQLHTGKHEPKGCSASMAKKGEWWLDGPRRAVELDAVQNDQNHSIVLGHTVHKVHVVASCERWA